MHKDLKSEILKRIREVIAEFKITSYEVAKKTALSELGVSKIISGKVNNPNESSIKLIIDFLIGNYGVNKDWLFTGDGNSKELSVPLPKEFTDLSASQKSRKLDEVAIFVAHHEKELMENPVFRSIVERIGYQIVVKALKEEGLQEKES